MKEELFTGALTVEDEQSGRLGVVAGFGPTEEPGRIHITVYDSVASWAEDDGTLTLELPEKCARHLVDQLEVTIIRLQHLRALRHLQELEESDKPDPDKMKA